jgi:hypothetical protein
VSDLTQHFAAIPTRERALADLSVEELGYLSSMDKSAIADLARPAIAPP